MLYSDNEDFPYAHYGDWNIMQGQAFAAVLERTNGTVFFAQDAQLRHVAIKLVADGTDEFRILRLIKVEPTVYDEELYPSMIRALEILPFQNYYFVIMPRWGANPNQPDFSHIFEIFTVVHSLLKALEFLHTHNIVHRDISWQNVLVNRIGAFYPFGNAPLRSSLRLQDRLRYTLFDFDLAIMFSADASPKQRRLRSQLSGEGNLWDQPSDTAQGEYGYDPFAFDVGCLGVTFCHEFQQHIPHAPMLAPFLDRMTTREISKRFPAAEARAFFGKKSSPLHHT